MEKKFMLENLIESIIKGSKLSDADSKTLRDAIDNEIRHKPFRVAIIGQSGEQSGIPALCRCHRCALQWKWFLFPVVEVSSHRNGSFRAPDWWPSK